MRTIRLQAGVEVLSGQGGITIDIGTITLSGGQDQTYTPSGGELFFDTNALYVGQSDGSFGKILYDALVSRPPQPQ